MTDIKDARRNAAFLTGGGGEMAELIRTHDWSRSPLGLPATWPQALRSAAQLCLSTPIVSAVQWGAELSTLYNDAYAAVLAERHPGALGRPLSEVWTDIWDVLGPQIATVVETGVGFSTEEQLLRMNRNGRLEDTYWIYSFAPLHDGGTVAGVFVTALDITEKVGAERRLTEVQEHQRQMLRQMPGFVGMLSGPDLVYTYVNDAYVAISERTDFVGRRFRDVFADIEGQGFFEAFEGAFRRGEGIVTRGMELRLHGRDDPQYVDFVLEPIRDEAGVVTGLFVGGYETTDVYRANEALRAGEARYRALFENIDAAFCVVEVIFDEEGRAVDHRFVEANPAFERQSGLKDALGKRAREILPAHEQHWFDIYGEIVRTGQPARFENGSDALGRWFDVRAMRVGTPEQCRVAILFNDITERKTAEQRMRELNETLERQVADRTVELRQFQAIVEATTSPICAFDTSHRLIAFNKAHNDEFRRVNGFDTKLGDVFPDLFIPEQRAAMRALMDRALTGEAFTVEAEFGRPELGVPVWEISYTPLRDATGAVVGAFHLAADISDRLRAEDELAAAQDALRQSQKMEAMGSLTGGVAHDFNNLLTPIIGSLDMLVRKGIGSERERRLIDGALQSAERAKTLVQRLLAFARRQPLQPTAVDVARLVEGMAGLIGSTLGPTIDLDIRVAEDVPPAMADPNQLDMALLNLAVNARDAMPDGGALTISAKRESVLGPHKANLQPGHYVRLCVGDTGVGMDQATSERAIEPFFSTKGIGKGTGLGLSMVHGLASQLGGGMLIESTPGEGTTIELWLPMSTQPVGDENDGDERPIERSGRGVALLVDDEDLVRMSTADMLIDLGYEVVEATSAEEALRLIDTGAVPDVLVTDHLMPGMSGEQLARNLRAIRPALPVLIVSGYAEAQGVAPDLPRLTKPFRNAELAECLAGVHPADATNQPSPE